MNYFLLILLVTSAFGQRNLAEDWGINEEIERLSYTEIDDWFFLSLAVLILVFFFLVFLCHQICLCSGNTKRRNGGNYYYRPFFAFDTVLWLCFYFPLALCLFYVLRNMRREGFKDYHFSVEQILDSVIAVIVALFMLMLLVLSIFWICSSNSSSLYNVGNSLISLWRNNSPIVSSFYFIFLAQCLVLAFIITYEIESWRGLVGQIAGVSTAVLLCCMYMGIAFPFRNVCVFVIFTFYEFAIYGTFIGMALWKILRKKRDYFVNPQIYLAAMICASFIFWLLLKLVIWRDDSFERVEPVTIVK